jgi:hypothetical protein
MPAATPRNVQLITLSWHGVCFSTAVTPPEIDPMSLPAHKKLLKTIDYLIYA